MSRLMEDVDFSHIPYTVQQYRDMLDAFMENSPNQKVVIFAESEQNWVVLWHLLKRKSEFGDTPRYDADYGGPAQHAMSVEPYIAGASDGRYYGWCGTEWYRQDPEYRKYLFVPFSEVFGDQIAPVVPEQFEDMWR